MAEHLVSAPVAGFHSCEGNDVEPAHFWSQGPLVNGVRSWQLIIKHDLTHRFHGQTLGVSPNVQVPHQWGTDVEPAHFWSQGLLVNGVRSWQLIIKHDLTHRFYSRTLGVRPIQCPGSTSVTAPMWNRPTSGAWVRL